VGPPHLNFPEGWSGTALDILKTEDLHIKNKLWVVLREEVLPEKLLRLFAAWCQLQVQHLKDERSIDIAEKYANGEALKASWGAVSELAGAAASEATDAMPATFDEAWFDASDTARYAAEAAALDAQLKKLIEMIEGNSDDAL
jgi:hypothetical protein